MGDHHDGRAWRDGQEPVDDLALSRDIDGAGRLVEHQQAGFAHHGAGYRNALAFPARDKRAALAHHGVESLLHAPHQSIRTGKRPNCDGPTGLHIAEQQMMAYVSARESRTIDLTTSFDLWWDREPGIMDLSSAWL